MKNVSAIAMIKVIERHSLTELWYSVMCPECRSTLAFQEEDTNYQGEHLRFPYSLECPVCRWEIYLGERATWARLEGEPSGD